MNLTDLFAREHNIIYIRCSRSLRAPREVIEVCSHSTLDYTNCGDDFFRERFHDIQGERGNYYW